MSKFELKLPRMGESVAEATLTSWLKEVGDTIEMDEPIFEIATDKVDSEVPSEVDGVLVEKRFDVDDIVKVGQVVAVIEIEGAGEVSDEAEEQDSMEKEMAAVAEHAVVQAKEAISSPTPDYSASERFYSPLVKNIAKEEGVSFEELESISGTGKEGRVTKNDILDYIEGRSNGSVEKVESKSTERMAPQPTPDKKQDAEPLNTGQKEEMKVKVGAGDEVIPMSRMGKLIAKHMADSVSTSAHVQSFIEVDVTNIVNWRNKVKAAFEKQEGEKLTFTPIFMEAVAKALKKYPMMNISVDGDNVIKKKNINIGMAAALSDGNLIVPVIKNADQLNLVGMAKVVNDLAERSRNNQLKPDEVKDGTYTVTNVGTFGSVFGTPIINQPQVGIMALGAIRKIPSVIETEEGDFIGVRSKMYLSHSYDHRVVNGALGSMFAKSVADYLEAWDPDREI
ncbi:dihydrolipoamide acetyltransferase family protein [Maribacter cobaltidurans]|uniref:Dihydrolipoamide acetyltransferase component of pyruvate dehydrogenase complex n=1 Tax=Maribacter cobaltidurans TaxID=1178778 RepID=A0A223V7E7_9FLAO|nr:dihydrolipoamide acetyltransferase family protein [Maribacter cobaltidurans]ASV31344.1 diapophytoene dehydrogenase [Maribacter cobaltidurans]GGD83044.1 dihydrolipoamide acetyltransferase component of pyruvate dehydrogenase complex [Maribacter cobaltidurans]